jgi:hypothetical protein
MITPVAPPPAPQELAGPLPPLPPATPPPDGRWRIWHSVAALGILAAIIGLAIWAGISKTLATDLNGRLPVWTFIALALLMLAFAIVIGWGITGHVGGLLADPVKGGRLSLSRLQVLAWTFLVLAAYLNAIVVNLARGVPDPLDVAIPGELLIAMGISVASLTGARIVLKAKEANNGVALPTDFDRDARTISANKSAVYKAGFADWRDLFAGDTAETAGALDLGKIQMFYITVALVLGYGIVVATGFAHVSDKITTLPQLDQAFVALLAISHAGYLTMKGAS